MQLPTKKTNTQVKYEVQFVFYLPFHLPSSDWENKSVSITVRGYISSAVLVVLPRSEAKKHVASVVPGEVEDYLSTPLLQSQEYLEAIVVLLFDKKSDPNQIFSKENVAKLQKDALSIANRFLTWCRILDREITIKSIPFVNKVDDRGFRQLYWPCDVQFLDVKTKERLDDRYCNQFGEMLGIRYQPKSKNLPWNLIQQKMESSPGLADLLSMDAYESWHGGHYRQFILDAASCVEIAVTTKLLRAASDKDLVGKLMRSYEERFTGKYFDTLPRLLGLSSLKGEDSDLFKLVNLLYNIRNDVIHKGEERFDEDQMNKIQNSLKKILEWCDSGGAG